MPSVDFYFDYGFPRAWLACARLRDAALRTGATIAWKPIVFAALPIDTAAAPDARQQAYERDDLRDWADYCGLEIRLPDGGPPNSEPAARGALVALAQGRILPYSEAVFTAYFTQGRDIGDVRELKTIAVQSGLDPDTLAAGLDDAALGDVLRANGEELLARGGFGPVTMFVGERMFVGHSRMPLVEFALGQTSDRAFVMPGQHG